uniref:Uncharacterized protein n=1 Tax=Anguilla anguilla TaxID=7936 RepID=A0A0E9RZ17_ANGAN
MTSKATGTGNTQGRLAWNSILSKWNGMEREAQWTVGLSCDSRHRFRIAC